MERMEYDPEGGNYLPVDERETGTTFIVVGLVMLLGAGGWALYLQWDINAGNVLMRILFTLDVLIALVLIVLGYIKKTRQKRLKSVD